MTEMPRRGPDMVGKGPLAGKRPLHQIHVWFH
jgi:hypothetical protein